MELSERIAELRDESLASLDEIHDSFAHTADLWRIAQLESMSGRHVTVNNPVTGASVTEQNVAELADKYVGTYMANATLQRFISLFEEFVFTLLTEYHAAFPRSLAHKELTLATVLDHSTTEAVVRCDGVPPFPRRRYRSCCD